MFHERQTRRAITTLAILFSATVAGFVSPIGHERAGAQEAIEATVTITKEVTGGDAAGIEFEISHNTGSVRLMAGESAVVAASPGQFQLFEGPIPGWAAGSIECTGAPSTVTANSALLLVAQVDVSAGDTIDCIVTNRPVERSTLTLHKEVVGAPAGDTTAFEFESSAFDTIDVSASAPVSVPVDAGSVSMFENLAQTVGWQFSSFVCDSDHTTLATGSRPQLRVTIPLETDVSCTVTNHKVAPVTITVTKTVIGGPADAVFEFEAAQYSAGYLDLPPLGNGDSATIEANPGSFTISEQLSMDWEEDVTCSGAPSFLYSGSGGQVSFAAEAGDVIACEFTNTFDGDAITTPQAGIRVIAAEIELDGVAEMPTGPASSPLTPPDIAPPSDVASVEAHATDLNALHEDDVLAHTGAESEFSLATSLLLVGTGCGLVGFGRCRRRLFIE